MRSYLTCYIGNYTTEVKEQGSSHNSETALQLITRCVNVLHFLYYYDEASNQTPRVDSKKTKTKKKQRKKEKNKNLSYT